MNSHHVPGMVAYSYNFYKWVVNCRKWLTSSKPMLGTWQEAILKNKQTNKNHIETRHQRCQFVTFSDLPFSLVMSFHQGMHWRAHLFLSPSRRIPEFCWWLTLWPGHILCSSWSKPWRGPWSQYLLSDLQVLGTGWSLQVRSNGFLGSMKQWMWV